MGLVFGDLFWVLIKQAIIDKEAYTVPQIKKACKAGTGCGGCVTPVGEVPKLLAHTLKKLGKAVASGICPHFSYSRHCDEWIYIYV